MNTIGVEVKVLVDGKHYKTISVEIELNQATERDVIESLSSSVFYWAKGVMELSRGRLIMGVK